MMKPLTRVVATDLFEGWFMGLDRKSAVAVDRVVGLLERMGVRLSFPYSSAIKGARYPLRELRVASGKSPLRVLYAFDPERNAVLLLGGDKSDARFYKVQVPNADRLFEQYLASRDDA